MLKRFWKWMTGASKRNVVYPFRPIGDAMRAKDAELYDNVCDMPLLLGAKKWREKYPEDFPELADKAQ